MCVRTRNASCCPCRHAIDPGLHVRAPDSWSSPRRHGASRSSGAGRRDTTAAARPADSATVGLGPTVSELRYRRGHPESVPTHGSRPATPPGKGSSRPHSRPAGRRGDDARKCALAPRADLGARRSVARQAPGHMAIAFDWVHDQLSPEERRQIAENIRTAPMPPSPSCSSAGRTSCTTSHIWRSSRDMAGLALYDEPGFEMPAAAYLDLAATGSKDRRCLRDRRSARRRLSRRQSVRVTETRACWS